MGAQAVRHARYLEQAAGDRSDPIAAGVEDAAVLSELLIGQPVDDQRWEAVTACRLPRAKASVQLGQWMLDADPVADVPSLMCRIAEFVSTPA